MGNGSAGPGAAASASVQPGLLSTGQENSSSRAALRLCRGSHSGAPPAFPGATQGPSGSPLILPPPLDSPVKEPSHCLPLGTPLRARLFTLGWAADFSASSAARTPRPSACSRTGHAPGVGAELGPPSRDRHLPRAPASSCQVMPVCWDLVQSIILCE